MASNHPTLTRQRRNREFRRKLNLQLQAVSTRDDIINSIEQACANKGLRMTEQRRVISRVLSESNDHPDVEELHRRAVKIDPNISIATIYRTMKLFEEAGVVARHDFQDGRSRYEEISENHHDHLIDVRSGEIIEFVNEEIELLQSKIAEELGYKLLFHRLELYGVPLKPDGA